MKEGLDLAWIAEVTGAARAVAGDRIQGLWSGYGEIRRVWLEAPRDGCGASVIVKWVRPPPSARGRSDARKRRSYEVEATFYARFAGRTGPDCRVAASLGARARGDERLLVLEDLDAAGFDRRDARPGPERLAACLAWLAAWHARFLGTAPEGLWTRGTYWHLATRPDELGAIGDPALRAAAPVLDAALAGARYLTLVHGDAKPANFCFARGGDVAAVDFQYVGGGVGVQDVAYLLDGEPPEREARLLDGYFAGLRSALRARDDVDADAVEAEGRRLYPIAAADYLRFIAGWAKDHYARDRRAQARVRAVLAALSAAPADPG